MDLNKIDELINVLEGSKTEEISVKKGDFAVHIKKGQKPKKAASAPKAKAGPVGTRVESSNTHSPDKYVLAPMVGVFHTAEGGAKAGSAISAGQVVGTIESMKLLNDVVSNLSGVVSEVLVEDGTPVEYGQALCKVEQA